MRKHTLNSVTPNNWWVSLAVLLYVALLPDVAFASESLGSMVCRISKNLAPYGDFVSAVAYVAGAFFIANGVMMLKQNAENANQAPMSRCVMMLVGGAACLALPEVVYIVQKSVTGGPSSANGLSSCSPVSPTTISTSTGAGLDSIFGNLFNNIAQPMQTVLSTLCLVMGAFLVAKGLMKAAKYGTDARASSMQAIMSNLIVGAVLLSVGQMTDIVMNSVFGITTSSITSFPTINWSSISSDSTSAGLDKVNTVVNAVLMFIQVVGMISFLRGWLIVKSAVEGSGQATIAQGITHIIGGVMAINIGGMAVILNYTFGLNIVSS